MKFPILLKWDNKTWNIWFHRPKWYCKFVGHNRCLGINGWENFGTGYYCSCGAMVDPKTKLEVFG